MTKRKKLIIIISVVVMFGITFAVGYFVGWFWGFQRGVRAGNLTAELAEFTLANQHIAEQMANADCLALKESLKEYLVLMERYKDFEHNVILSRTTYYGDKMLTHARLARIERKLGNKKEVENQMKLAVEACKQRGWRDCSEEKIIFFTKKIEEKNPIGCLSDSK
jgi:hypothetical protein